MKADARKMNEVGQDPMVRSGPTMYAMDRMREYQEKMSRDMKTVFFSACLFLTNQEKED